MNSCTSTELSACAPPLMMFIIGTGSTCAFGPPTYRNSSSPDDSAAALATASDTPSSAFAPSRDLSGVPSRSTSALVDQPLVDGLHAGQLGADLVEDGGDGLLDALAAEPQRVAVAQLDRLVLAGRRPGGHRGPGQRPVVQGDLDLDRRVPSRVEDLAGADLLDDRHQ